MKKRVVITGAAGFIGSHLAEALLDEDCSVVGVDNLLTGNLANIAHLAGRDFVFVKHDVTNYINVDGPVDVVLHWASPGQPDERTRAADSDAEGRRTRHPQGAGPGQVEARAVRASRPRLVYGDPLEHPQTESYWGHVNPIGPRSVYDEAKRFSEALTMGYHRDHGVDTHIVRIFNTYGPRMRLNDGRALPNFVFQALSEKPIYRLRRWPADPQLLLCGRSCRRHSDADGFELE